MISKYINKISILIVTILSLSANTSNASVPTNNGFSYTISASNIVNWNNSGLGDFLIVDGSLSSPSGSHGDAFDNGALIEVCASSGCAYNGTYATYTGSGSASDANTYQGALQSNIVAGMNLTASYRFSSTLGLSRMLVKIDNTTSSSLTRTVRLKSDLGCDSGCHLKYQSSNGSSLSNYFAPANVSYTTSAFWTITSDQAANTGTLSGNDPIVSFAYGSSGATVSPSTTITNSGGTNLFTILETTVPANSTRFLVFFIGFGEITTAKNTLSGAYNGTNTFLNSWDSIPSDLKSDLSSAQLSQVLNWRIGTNVTSFLPNSTVTKNSTINYSLEFSESVNGLASNDFAITGTGSGTCTVSVSGSSTTYAVSLNNCSEGTVILALSSNSVTNNASQTGPANSVTATTVVVDRTNPIISNVTAPSNSTYKPADTPTFTVAFSESVTVTGTPRLVLTVGSVTEYANYISQTDSRTALFRYTVLSEITEFDTDGISLSNTLDLNGGAIADLATNALSTLTFSAPNTASIFVAQPPAVPTIDSATAGSGFISIYFTAGATYGSAITNYQYSTNNGTNWNVRSPVETSTPLTISGLTNGTQYQVRIRAVSAVGTSDSSTLITARPNAVTVAAGSNISTTYGRSASSSTFTSTGGVSPYVYTLSSSIPGISISNGVVTASSTVNAGTYSLNVVSTDAYLANGTKAITITVAKATQDTLTVTSSNAIFSGSPSSLSLLTSGGSDTGTVTYSVVAGGSAIGCSISGSLLWVNTSGTCKLVATKATTTNYLIAYSDTATISFAVFVSRQPVQTQSAPTQLPINGQNSLDLSQTNTVPAVTGVFLVGSTYEINGTGFTGVTRVVIGGAEATITSSTATKIVINSAGLMPGPLFIECSDGRIGPSPFYFFTP
jgi:hypothetical protein